MCKQIKSATTDEMELNSNVVPALSFLGQLGPSVLSVSSRSGPSVRLNTCSLARDQYERFFAARDDATAVQMLRRVRVSSAVRQQMSK